MKNIGQNMNRGAAGFSLVELLVVLGIISVLTGLVAFNFNAARTRARDVQRKHDFKLLKEALELYKNDNNQSYPATTDYTSLIGLLSTSGYIQPDLSDPKVTITGDSGSWEQYDYDPGQTTTYYILKICMENRADPILAEATQDCGPGGAGRLYVYVSKYLGVVD